MPAPSRANSATLIRPARPADIATVQAIEVAAGEAFRDIGMTTIADDPPPPTEVVLEFVESGRAWVASESNGPLVGYLLLDDLDESAHIEQVTVRPSFGRRGIGALLIEQAVAWASANGYRSLTLTTFADVPWNAPYYRRLGFSEVPLPACSPDLRQLVAEETANGLAAWPRVVMARPTA